MAVSTDVADYADLLNAAASDVSLDPDERVARLRILKRRILDEDPEMVSPDTVTLLGHAETYIGGLELQREAFAMTAPLDAAQAREDAEVRDALIAQGVATPAELDAAGWPSHDALDAAREDGTTVPPLEEAAFGAALDPEIGRKLALKRHRNRGRFADEVGVLKKLKARSGTNVKPPKVPKTPKVPAPKKTPGPGYEERRNRLQRRATAAAAEGVEARGPQSPGTAAAVVDPSPTPDPQAPRTFGHASQKELLAYARNAATQPTTVDAYSVRDPATGRRIYDESRREEHQRIIDEMLADIPSQEEPHVFFTGGGYASGKGGVVDTHPDVPPDALVLDPDVIKGKLPEFQELLETDPEANLLVYEEAWDISQELQRQAIAKRANVIVDGISDTSPEDMLGRVKVFTDAGYKDPKVVYVSIPTEEAIKRAEKRARKAKKPSDRRFIPDVIMRSVHRDVSSTMPGIVKGAKDLGLSIEVWDNNQGWNEDTQTPVPPVQSFSYTPDGGEEILKPDLWDDFLHKGNEKIPGVDAPVADASDEELQVRWAALDRELLPYAGNPQHPEARRIIAAQQKITEERHARRKAPPKGEHAEGTPRDLLVIGAGPAGLSAAIYGGTEGLDTLLVDANPEPGGQAGMSSRIENVLGFPAGVTGEQYAQMGFEQAQRVGAETALGVRVEKMEHDEKTGLKTVHLSDGRAVQARSVVIAGGVQFNEVPLPGGDAEGVVYGDSSAIKELTSEGDDVLMVGGANSAGQAALDVSNSGRNVTVLIRRGSIRDKMSEYLVKQLEGDPGVTIKEGAEIAEVHADDDGKVSGVTLKDGSALEAKAIGLFIGSGPRTDWAGVERDQKGKIAVGNGDHGPLETSTPGVFAAGDVRSGSIGRVVIAAADGASAVSSVHGWMSEQKKQEAAANDPIPDVAEVSAEEYFGSFSQALADPKFGAFLTNYTAEDFKQMRTFTAAGGKVGGAIKKTESGNEAVALFNLGGPKGAGRAMLRHLVDNGADRLDAFGDGLRKIYESEGFEVTEEVAWNDEYAPDNWDYNAQGRPPVFFMRHKDG